MRNMIEQNQNAFNNLIFQINQKKSDLTIRDGARYIKTNDNEKDWLKELKVVDDIQISQTLKALLIEFKEMPYICIIGDKLDENIYDNQVLIETDVNSGLVTFLISNNYLTLSKTSNILDFYDNIMFQNEDEGYKGHNFEELLQFMVPLNFYALPLGSVLNNNLERIVTYIFSKNKDRLVLDFNTEVLNKIERISLEGPDSVSYQLILNCLLSVNNNHAFLDLYRLVERIFPIIYLKEFHQESRSELSFLEFTSKLENITGWRPREEDALEKMFGLSQLNTFDQFITRFYEGDDTNRIKSHKFFYRLRNSIVHFRANHEEIELNKNNWNEVFYETLSLIEEQYFFYDKDLNE